MYCHPTTTQKFSMNLLQCLISIKLYSGHASKQVHVSLHTLIINALLISLLLLCFYIYALSETAAVFVSQDKHIDKLVIMMLKQYNVSLVVSRPLPEFISQPWKKNWEKAWDYCYIMGWKWWTRLVRTESTIFGPWRSNDPRPSPNFSPWLRDKIWECESRAKGLGLFITWYSHKQ